MKKIFLIIIIVIIGVSGYLVLAKNLKQRGIAPSGITPLITNSNLPEGQDLTKMSLKVADGFKMSIYAHTSAGVRDLELDPQGNLLVSLTDKGKVLS
ncbi:hypothetical protein KW795_02935, partial [Candidatus Microgenomates bacterium]|nr:hypothetical protein [Candidatus Microgenomates bacterium]